MQNLFLIGFNGRGLTGLQVEPACPDKRGLFLRLRCAWPVAGTARGFVSAGGMSRSLYMTALDGLDCYGRNHLIVHGRPR